jgi:hypothetical protein
MKDFEFKNIDLAETLKILKTICMYATIAIFSLWAMYSVISLALWFFTMMFLYPTIALVVLLGGFLAMLGITRMIEIYNNK